MMEILKETDIRFHIVGDCAISIELGNEISLETNLKVRALQQLLESRKNIGISEMVPTYTNLMVHYDPELIAYGKLVKYLKTLVNSLETVSIADEKVVEIPILYGGEAGTDLDECAALEGVSVEELIRMHSSSLYYTYMLGFAPGHPYMARFEDPFSFKRRETPRVKIPAGSVVVAENLSNLIPFDQPCGWNIIGHTPVRIFNEEKEPPSLINAGNWVKFVAIDEAEYKQIREQVEKGEYTCRTFLKETVK